MFMAAFILSFLKWSFLTLIALLVVGMLFEQYARWSLERKAIKGKTFVEINGKPLHYVKKGLGNYTIVFQSGMGSSHAIWQPIQDELAQNAVTISYDRNGIMFSEDNGLPITNENVSRELEALLLKTNCPKPYILVGHSMAGIYLRSFIDRNKKDISGILFLEAAHPQQIAKASPELIKLLTPPPLWLAKLAVNTGFYRIFFSFFPLSPEIPLNHPLHQVEKDFFYKSCDKIFKEVANDQLNFKDAEKYTSFGDIPLTVIMGSSAIRYANIKNQKIKEEYCALVKEVQEDLLKLSSNSRMVEAPNSGHLPQIKDSQLIILAIRQLLLLTNLNLC